MSAYGRRAYVALDCFHAYMYRGLPHRIVESSLVARSERVDERGRVESEATRVRTGDNEV